MCLPADEAAVAAVATYTRARAHARMHTHVDDSHFVEARFLLVSTDGRQALHGGRYVAEQWSASGVLHPAKTVAQSNLELCPLHLGMGSM